MSMPLVTITTFDVIVMMRERPMGGGTCVYKPHLFGARIIIVCFGLSRECWKLW